MKSVIVRCLLACLFVLASSASHANLIINGGFEDNDVNNNSWRWFKAEQVPGWEGSHIEIWDSLQRFESIEGEQHAELNAHAYRGVYSIHQTFDTFALQNYRVSFAYAARRSLSEAFLFEILNASDSPLFSKVFDDHQVKQWKPYQYVFTADSSQTTIKFTSLNSGTLGNFLDAVSVVGLPSVRPNNSAVVTAPSTILIFTLAIAGMLLGRRVIK